LIVVFFALWVVVAAANGRGLNRRFLDMLDNIAFYFLCVFLFIFLLRCCAGCAACAVLRRRALLQRRLAALNLLRRNAGAGVGGAGSGACGTDDDKCGTDPCACSSDAEEGGEAPATATVAVAVRGVRVVTAPAPAPTFERQAAKGETEDEGMSHYL
jgi:hypothetical protein